MKIPFKGIVKNTPAGLAQDGELEDVLNVRYKDGAWRPIPERVAIFGGETLPYTNIFVHSNAGYKHYLGLKDDGKFEYFAEDVNNDPTLLNPEDVVELTTITAGATFTQIGNVININDNGLKYLIWYDSAYVLINSNFDGAQDSTTVGPVKVDLKVDGLTNESGVRKLFVYRSIQYGYSSESAFNSDSETRIESAKSLFIKALSTESEKGRLNGYCIACTAIELYDGTYILHSSPILLGKSYDANTRYEKQNSNYLTNKNIFVPSSGSVFEDDISEDFTNELYSSKEGLVDFPDAVCGYHYNSNVNRHIMLNISSNMLKYKIENDIEDALKPLIKSISLFLTPQVSVYKTEKNPVRVTEGSSITGFTPFAFTDNYQFVPKTNAEIIKELSELKNFYKVHEIPFDQIQAGDWTLIDLKDKLGDSLLTLQPLPIDNFSHHTTLPEVQFVYNSKLHIANYKTELSRGWPVNYFEQTETGIGQFPTTIDNTADVGVFVWSKVFIKTENGSSEVVRLHNYIGARSTYSLTPIISYPDIRAYKIQISVSHNEVGFDSGSIVLEYALKESIAGNYAYYISPDLKPIAYTVAGGTPYIEAPSESNRSQIYQNTLKVSEVNNPFLFPAANTYQIGNGDIIGLATNTVALSTGQFGQFPVYVFCTDGIYGLYVGGAEINYSSSRPVSREVCNNAHSIKAIDTGVIFTTDKGVMVLVGSEVKELSEPLKGGIFDIDKLSLFKQALNHVKLTQLLSEITTETIHDYIQSAIVGYNYTEREIWFTNPDLSYSYIFSQGAWYKVKQTGSRYIDDYPKQYILEEGKLIDISSETGTYQQVYLLTRPVKMGDVEFKQMLTSVIRGRMLVENTGTAPAIQKKWAGIHVYGSYDGERWVFLGGNEKFGELNDFGTRVERTDCRYYRIAFYGNINNDSYINYLELEGKQSILSTKLR